MTIAPQVREMRRSVSWRWLPVSEPRPIRKGVCAMRTYLRAPSGEMTSSTASLWVRVSVMRRPSDSPAERGILACAGRLGRVVGLVINCGELFGCSEATVDVVVAVGEEGVGQTLGDRSGSAVANRAAGNFADRQDVAVGGSDKDFVGFGEIAEVERMLGDGSAGFGGDFHQDAAGYPFEASGIERRGKDLFIFHDKDICGGAFGDFAPLVEHKNFVEAGFLRFRESPDVIEPGNCFYTGERGGGVAAPFASGEPRGGRIFRKVGGGDDQIDFRHFFGALPEAHGVPDQIDAGATFFNLVGANNFLKIDANFRAGVRHGHADERGVFFKAAPVTFVGEGFAPLNLRGGKESPAVDEAGLTRGPTSFFDGNEIVVMKYVAMYHASTRAEWIEFVDDRMEELYRKR